MTALTDAIAALSPTHYWKFDEAAGSTAADSGSGTALPLTHNNSPSLAVSGPTVADVGIGYDGVNEDSRAVISGAASLGTSNTGTWLYFIKYDVTGQFQPVNLTRIGNQDPEIVFDKTSSNLPRSINVLSQDGSANPQYTYTANARALITGDWNLLAFVHTGTDVLIWSNNGFLPDKNTDFTNVGAATGGEWLDDSRYSVLTSFNVGSIPRVATVYTNCDVSNLAYFDGVALTEQQLVGIYDIFVAAVTPPTPPLVGNTFAATLSGFGPSHWWRLREGQGDLLDTGSVGGLDLADDIGLRNTWRRAPGPIRGQPREYALWGNQNIGSGLERIGTGLPVTGFNTGVLGAAVYVNSTNNEIIYLLNQVYNSLDTHILELTIELDGSIQMRVGDLAQDFLTAKTAAGVILDSTSHVIVGLQRGDSTGLRIYDNGVDITLSNVPTGAATLNSFVGDLLSGESASILGVGSFDGDASGGALISNPFVFVSSVLTTENIAALTTSAQLTNTNMSDYFEQVFLLAGSLGFTFWFAGWVVRANFDMVNPGADIIEMDNLNVGGFTGGTGTFNIPEAGGVGKQIISEFQNYFTKFGSVNSNYATTNATNIDSNDSLGTYNFIGKISGVTGNRIWMQYGNGSSVGGNVTNMSFFIQLSGTDYKWGVHLHRVGGDFFQALSSPDYTLDADAITMLTIVQDGTTGIKFYVDGSLISILETDSGTSYDNTSWFAAVDAFTGSDDLVIGSRIANIGVENFQPNEIHDIFMVRRAYTTAEISTLWDAVNGIFPSVGTPGKFNDLILITGNDATGPDHYWRMNDVGTVLADSGIRPNRAVDPITGATIQQLGNPLLGQASPLPLDETAKSILFDGTLDAYEVGVNGVSGSLIDNLDPSQTGSIGFFFLPTALKDSNIVYSQGDISYGSFLQVGFNQDKLEVIIQRAANSKVTVTSGNTVSSTAFNFVVITCDGSEYALYLNGRQDPETTTFVMGSAARGDWFRAIITTLSALSAKGTTGFTTETTGNVSEVFIYDPDVLTPEEIIELFDAAVEDGFTGISNIEFHRTGITSASNTLIVFDSEADT